MTQIIQRSFTSGELAPGLRVRADLGKYATGLTRCKNFIVRSQGGAYSRPGMRFVGELNDSTKEGRLIPFSFNVEQTYILVFEHLKIRIVKNGGYVTETAKVITAITQANPALITSVAHGYATGDEIAVSSIVGMTELNARTFKITVSSVDDFTLDGVDSSFYTSYISGGIAERIYEITTTYTEADIVDIGFTQSADVMTLAHRSHDPKNLSRLADDNWTLTTIPYTPDLGTPASLSLSSIGSGGSTFNKVYYYVVTAFDEDSDSESLPTGQASRTQLSLTSTWGIKVSWASVTDADFYRIYKSSGGNNEVFGLIGESRTTTFADFNIQPDITIAPPNERTPFDTVDNKPGVVNYYQQRQLYAATNKEPQTLYTTQTGNFSSLRTSSPSRADDAVTLTIANRQVNQIRHIVSLDALILLTSGGEWLVTEGNDEVLSPDTVGVRIQSYNGASKVPPAVINDTVVYVQDKGSTIRDLGYSFTSDKYTGNDLSVMSKHLFENCIIREMDYAAEPYGILWCVKNDGILLGMTYQREHQVWGWHQHNTQGSFESVAVVSENQRDAVYFIVKRNINGSDVRYIERMEIREEINSEDCFYVDAGLSYVGALATVISGLDHLEGEGVTVLADGNTVTGLTVSGGQITLPVAALKVHVGLAYVPELITLGIDDQREVIRGHSKSASDIRIIIHKSRGGWVGPVNDLEDEVQLDSDLLEIKPRFQSDEYNTISLKSFEQRIAIKPGWNDDAKIRIVQKEPLPLTILAIIPDIDLGG